MSLEYTIHHPHRLIVATGRGLVTTKDVFGYQHMVGADRSLADYDELFDFTGATGCESISAGRLEELANLAASMDGPTKESRLAIVATDDVFFGLARMYEAYREITPDNAKEVAVFRTLPEAMEFLGLRELPPEAAESPAIARALKD